MSGSNLAMGVNSITGNWIATGFPQLAGLGIGSAVQSNQAIHIQENAPSPIGGETDIVSVVPTAILNYTTLSLHTTYPIINNGAHGTVTNLFDYWARVGSKISGTVTNQYGIYVENPTFGSTSNIGIYDAGSLSVASGQKLYLDGGGNNYLEESSANVIDVFTGGFNILDINGASGGNGLIEMQSPSGSGNMDVRITTTGTDIWSLLGDRTNRKFDLGLFGNQAVTFDINGNVALGNGTGAESTTATNGYPEMCSMAGIPSGTPTIVNSKIPFCYDTIDHRFYVYESGGWHYFARTA